MGFIFLYLSIFIFSFIISFTIVSLFLIKFPTSVILEGFTFIALGTIISPKRTFNGSPIITSPAFTPTIGRNPGLVGGFPSIVRKVGRSKPTPRHVTPLVISTLAALNGETLLTPLPIRCIPAISPANSYGRV